MLGKININIFNEYNVGSFDTRRSNMKTDFNKKIWQKKLIANALLASSLALLSQNALAIGGCGSSHIPLQSGGGQGVVKIGRAHV